MKKLLLISLVVAIVSAAGADVLWDQPPNGADNWVDHEHDDFPDYSSYMVVDVVVGPPGWNITKITTYYTAHNYGWDSNMDARLNIFAKAGSLPGSGDDPRNGLLVEGDLGGTVTVTYASGMCAVEAAGLNVDVVPGGDYWLGLTVVGDWAIYGHEWHLDSTPRIGDATAWRNPGDGFGYGTDWISLPPPGSSYEDMSITIEGTIIPEPVTLSLLALGAIGLLRRR